MRGKLLEITPELYDYILARGTRPDPGLDAVGEITGQMGDLAQMQTGPDQAALITLLVRAIGAGRALEIGTFTGYGAIAIARGLPDHGKLITLELDPERAELAAKHVRDAGVEDRVEIRLGPALESLQALPAEPSFDFAYIDADKPSYAAYYEESLARLRSGGLIMLDNTLLEGRVLEPEGDVSASAIAALNAEIAADERVDLAMVGISDGVTLALKR